MYERMLDKDVKPSLADMHAVIGSSGMELMKELEEFLYSSYDIAVGPD